MSYLEINGRGDEWIVSTPSGKLDLVGRFIEDRFEILVGCATGIQSDNQYTPHEVRLPKAAVEYSILEATLDEFEKANPL